MKTYEAVESQTAGVGRKVTVELDDKIVAVFYPQAFANGAWSDFTAGIAKRGGSLHITNLDGSKFYAVGNLDEITADVSA